MKNIMLVIMILASFALGNIESEIRSSFKRLGKCDISHGKKALEIGLGKDGIELHKQYSGAVYFNCEKGYVMYVQDMVEGSFIRGEVCKIGRYDFVEGCSSSSSWFTLSTVPNYEVGSGYFLEDDKYGIRIKEEDLYDTQYNAERMLIRLYNTLKKRYLNH